MKKLKKPKKYSDTNVEFYGGEVTSVTSPSEVNKGPTPPVTPTGGNSSSSSSSSDGTFQEIFDAVWNALNKGN